MRSDGTIDLDAQLKQRLTGAVILVLLAVLLVPELLRGPGEAGPAATGAAAQPASVEDASGEGAPLRSYEIDLSDEPPAASAAPDAVGTPPANPGAPVSAASGSPAPAAAPARAPPAPSQVAPASDASPAANAAPASPLRGFAVQVGSFASRGSADRLAGELRSRRFETFVSPVRSGNRQLYRVRVGPVSDRAAAQALVARLKSAGQKGSVVTLP